MKRRTFLASAAAGLPRRPNVLFILPDQLRAQSVGCHGNREVLTPNIDRLAEEGLRLDATFANTPVCCPARAILLTGQYCHKNGMTANDLRLREDHVTLSSELSRAGYQTAFIGKWHLDGGPRLPGFVPPGPRRHGFGFWAANECSHRHFDNTYFRDTPEPLQVRGFEPEGWTDLTLEFIDGARKRGAPWFATVQMGPPHDPYGAPEEQLRRYDAARLTPRPNWKEAPGVAGRKELAAYYAATSAIDDQVGRMMRALDEWGLDEDTVVLFSSDHGDMLGSHGLRLKRKPFEESIRVPGVVRYRRRVKAGRVSPAMWSHIDFAPTLLGLCGVSAPASMQGEDRTPLLTGASGKGAESCFFQIFGPYLAGGVAAGWRGVRTARYMYARYRERPWVLYDLERDPFEQDNLAGGRAAAKLASELDAKLVAWMRRAGDSWSNDWTEPVEDGGRLYRDRVWSSVNEYMEAQRKP